MTQIARPRRWWKDTKIFSKEMGWTWRHYLALW